MSINQLPLETLIRATSAGAVLVAGGAVFSDSPATGDLVRAAHLLLTTERAALYGKRLLGDVQFLNAAVSQPPASFCFKALNALLVPLLPVCAASDLTQLLQTIRYSSGIPTSARSPLR